MDDRKHPVIHPANHAATPAPEATRHREPRPTLAESLAGNTATGHRQRLSKILHDEKGNAVFLLEPVPSTQTGQAVEIFGSAPEPTTVPDGLDTVELTLEVDELYDGDTHNPYSHDHETLHKHQPTPERVDRHELAAWHELVHGIERDKKRRGG